MGSTTSTAHRLEIRRALYLTPSDNKKVSRCGRVLRVVRCIPRHCEAVKPWQSLTLWRASNREFREIREEAVQYGRPIPKLPNKKHIANIANTP